MFCRDVCVAVGGAKRDPRDMGRCDVEEKTDSKHMSSLSDTPLSWRHTEYPHERFGGLRGTIGGGASLQDARKQVDWCPSLGRVFADGAQHSGVLEDRLTGDEQPAGYARKTTVRISSRSLLLLPHFVFLLLPHLLWVLSLHSIISKSDTSCHILSHTVTYCHIQTLGLTVSMSSELTTDVGRHSGSRVQRSRPATAITEGADGPIRPGDRQRGRRTHAS